MDNNMHWTEPQYDAISSRNETLLVSAAAGSGKTAVLTARIISRITDTNNPCDISRICIVTFTKAAATELKDRISKALSESLAQNPQNQYLEKQLIKLGRAHISTIHSFCLDIISQNFSVLGLPAKMSIADDARISLLKNQTMNDVIDHFYNTSDSSISDFGEFCDNFVTDRDDRLSDIFLSVSDKLSSFADGTEYVKTSAEELRRGAVCDFFSTKWGEVICNTVLSEMSYYQKIFRTAAEYIRTDEKYTKNYAPSFEYDLNFAKMVCDSLEASFSDGGYEKILSMLSDYQPIKLGHGVKASEMTDELTFFKEMRTKFSKQLEKIKDGYFSYSAKSISEKMNATADILDKLYIVLHEFDKRYSAVKLLQRILDYSDLERMAYRLLYNSDGTISSIAKNYSTMYDEIYIDEYQDVNALQDMIFTAFSSPHGRFMVGDIKQSIYGFRGAAPDIFADYRDRYPCERGGDCRKIFLSNNFRCDRNIIDFTNAVSTMLFTNNSGRVPYYPEDALIYSKSGENSDTPVKIMLYDKNDDGDSDEARNVACEIKRLISEGYSPSQIVILLRSVKTSAAKFEKELAQLSIPVYNSVSNGFFENAEIMLVMSLLNVIDNPTRDIYLAGVLRSPIFGFTLDELASIRLCCGSETGDTLYSALLSYYKSHTDFYKAQCFFEAMTRFRKYAQAQPVDRLIWLLYRECGILSMVSAGIEISPDNASSAGFGRDITDSRLRRSNLMLLYEYARKFESGAFKGLYNFILYVNDTSEHNFSFASASTASESDETVKIMSIHSSKGLEFPVCFICDSSHGFNESDNRENLLCGRGDNLGIAVRLRDETGFARYDTPIRRAISGKIARNNLDEEMRVLYVAMTRARERLYITASVSNSEELIQNAEISARFISPYIIARNANYINWIMTALSQNGIRREMYTLEINDELSVKTIAEPYKKDELTEIAGIAEPKLCDETEQYKNILSQRFAYVYPYERIASLPAKLSVSKLFPGILDDDGTDGIWDLSNKKRPMIKSRPRFLESHEEASTSAERGTATHIFMQFCDFSNTEKNGVDDEIERLISGQFIPRNQAELIYKDLLKRFFSGKLYADMKNAVRLWREIRFNIKFPAREFSDNPEFKTLLDKEEILVQGVIDCFFITSDNRTIIVDYKTDYLTMQERENYDIAAAKLLAKHKTQLGYYRLAVKKLIGREVDAAYIYSFWLGDTIEVI